MARRHPRCPSIGFNSCNLVERSRTYSRLTPACLAISAISSSLCGKNSCKGGSSKRIVTGSPFMIWNSSMKSCRCMGKSLSNAFWRPAVSLAIIISRTATIRSASKNMCSVRLRPMPSAPNSSAIFASVGVSALARIFIRRAESAQEIKVPNTPDNFGWIVATSPR